MANSYVRRAPVHHAKTINEHYILQSANFSDEQLEERRNYSPQTPAYRFLNAKLEELDISEDPKWVAEELVEEIEKKPRRSGAEIITSGRGAFLRVERATLRGVGDFNTFANLQLKYAGLTRDMVADMSAKLNAQQQPRGVRTTQDAIEGDEILSGLLSFVNECDDAIAEMMKLKSKEHPIVLAIVSILAEQRAKTLAHARQRSPNEPEGTHPPAGLPSVTDAIRPAFDEARSWLSVISDEMLRAFAMKKALLYGTVRDEREYNFVLAMLDSQATM
ncbi:MAG: hypothetical protein M1160_03850 [Candidatus Marsarchaeota archaeon]|nr:hypothetical protein [Candidatus Marsarchaeota archaeon]MCL5111976.1 hypothetical protein [Candidatus Marsarchaeota archaeon]